jgi:CheY-like chemotaxis protein
MTKTRILIVEDQLATGAIIEWQLAELGETRLVATEMEAAQAIPWLLEGDVPSVAVVDVGLPDRQGIVDPDAGFRVLAALAEHAPRTPAITMTIRNDRGGFEKCRSLHSVWYFFTKPWDSTQLKSAVRSCLSGARADDVLILRGHVEGSGGCD